MSGKLPTSSGIDRRTVLGGIAGFGGLWVSSSEALAESEFTESELFDTDPHTRDTFRGFAEAIVPETPELEDELGPESVPGALEIELEEYLIWTFNNFQEKWIDFTEFGDVELETQQFWHVGSVERIDVESVDRSDTFWVTVETEDEVIQTERPNYPHAEILSVVLDFVALELVFRFENEYWPWPNTDLPDGGMFCYLHRRDRLRAVQLLVNDGIFDKLEDAFGDVFPHIGMVEFISAALNGLAQLGYYTEWAGYGDTKTDPPNDREFDGDVLGYKQTGYPGRAAGYSELREFPGDGVFELGADGFRENDY